MNYEKYKKFVCIKCGNIWYGFAKKPRCKTCGSRKINIFPAYIEDRDLKQLGAKIENEEIIEEVDQDLSQDLDFIISDDKTEDEEIRFKCGNCGKENIRYGDLFCQDCGQAIDVEWQ